MGYRDGLSRLFEIRIAEGLPCKGSVKSSPMGRMAFSSAPVPSNYRRLPATAARAGPGNRREVSCPMRCRWARRLVSSRHGKRPGI